MAIYTGRLTDPAWRSLQSRSVEVIITLEKFTGGISEDRLFATREVRTTPDADGFFSVDIVSSEALRGSPWYRIAVTWLDSAGSYSRVDLGRFFARSGGGPISDMGGEVNWAPAQAVWQEEVPEDLPLGWLWFQDNDQGIVYRRVE
ncbi:hypothetical protein D9V32_13415 [Mycetocola tolaasinivorans]|uniref:Uncharacterized protein n=1 Tax=Mycetocola tolaasinivorans TaxID=76635 RepID=A0A3L7A452_9MICO|nr:hypothetical protein D9V32_13415 [Mycetocola tolaasinivorans]